jgi:hypothetical protein
MTCFMLSSAQSAATSLENRAALETIDSVSDATLAQLVGRANAVVRTVLAEEAKIGLTEI